MKRLGLFLSGYNRNTSVIGNEFAWIGGNAIASWGFTNDSSAEVDSHTYAYTINGNYYHMTRKALNYDNLCDPSFIIDLTFLCMLQLLTC